MTGTTKNGRKVKLARTVRTDRARAVFLETLEATCNVSEAARRAGMGRRTAYDWREAEPDFAAAWDEAEAAAADKLEQVAFERATSGESDRMLEILLKAHRPEKFVERSRIDHGVTPEAAELITKAISSKEAAERYRDELG